MIERFRRYQADTIRYRDRTTDRWSDSNIPTPTPNIYTGGGGIKRTIQKDKVQSAEEQERS